MKDTRQKRRRIARKIKKEPELIMGINIVIGAFILNLHDKYGFGKKRLQDLLGMVTESANDIASGELYSYSELMEHIKDEYDIKL